MSFKPVKRRDCGTAKDCASRLVGDYGGAKAAAHRLGCSSTTVYALTDPDEDEEMTLAQAAELAVHSGSLAPAEFFAGLAGAIVTPVAPSHETLAVLCARGELEHGKVMAALCLRLSGADRADRRARDGMLRELDAMLGAFALARTKLLAEDPET